MMLKYLTSVMIASWTSSPVMQHGSISLIIGEWLYGGGLFGLLALVHAAQWPRGRAGAISFLLAILIEKGFHSFWAYYTLGL